jgi:two-component system, NarL family, sensor histidine kinase DegS
MVTGRAQQDKPVEENGLDALRNKLRNEVSQGSEELKEIDLMLEQSQLEVNKLTQRNTSVTTHLQQVQTQFDIMPRGDIRTAYDAALDAQQRLFMMRGQLDKLQSDRNRIAHFHTLLQQVSAILEEEQPHVSGAKGISTSTVETVEMMIRAQEAERQRLARAMHDGPAQALSNFILQIEIAVRLFDLDQTKAREELGGLKTAATSTFQRVRDFIFELRPMMLDDLGLAPTISRYVEAFKEQSGIDVRVMISGLEQRLESYLEVMIFRAVQELLSNVSRHSQASQVKMQIDANDVLVKVSVDDNGKGFDVDTLSEQGGMGLKVIRDRVDMLGGVMEIKSAIGQGARVMFEVPAAKTKVFA